MKLASKGAVFSVHFNPAAYQLGSHLYDQMTSGNIGQNEYQTVKSICGFVRLPILEIYHLLKTCVKASNNLKRRGQGS